MTYDYLIVGAGLFGAVFAHEARSCGKRVLLVEKRPHIGGNVYTTKTDDIDVHCYGAHIFHTHDREVWDYVNRFSSFNRFVNSPIAKASGRLYNLPFNMNTFHQLWGVTTPAEAKAKIEEQRQASGVSTVTNLEEQAISLVGTDIYRLLIKGYTEKQWGRDCRELPPSIIKRIPLRFTFDNNYFNDPYQGIPDAGYTALVEKLLDDVEVRLNVDFTTSRSEFNGLARKIIFTGPIDSWFDCCEGTLNYRTLRFETQTLPLENFQGVAVMNYNDRDVPYTRTIEHKHFTFGQQTSSVVTWEYPLEWTPGAEPFYPVNDKKNQDIFARYRDRARSLKNVHFAGRLGTYRYLDMDEVIREALDYVGVELKGC